MVEYLVTAVGVVAFTDTSLLYYYKSSGVVRIIYFIYVTCSGLLAKATLFLYTFFETVLRN